MEKGKDRADRKHLNTVSKHRIVEDKRQQGVGWGKESIMDVRQKKKKKPLFYVVSNRCRFLNRKMILSICLL